MPADDEDAGPVAPLSTDNGGKAPPAVDGQPPKSPEDRKNGRSGAGIVAEAVDKLPLDLASAALADAREISQNQQGRPGRRRDRDAARRTRRENLAGRNGGVGKRGGYSGPAPDATDPQRLGPILAGYIGERGWDRPIAQARVFAEWSELVGADVAAHCAPQALHDGELRVAAESTAWATQLRLLAATLLARLVAELGPDVVTKLHITGPSGPSWKHGGRSVRGARGPRDTYG